MNKQTMPNYRFWVLTNELSERKPDFRVNDRFLPKKDGIGYCPRPELACLYDTRQEARKDRMKTSDIQDKVRQLKFQLI